MKYTDNFSWPVHVQNFISPISFATFAATPTRMLSVHLAVTFHIPSETTGSNKLHRSDKIITMSKKNLISFHQYKNTEAVPISLVGAIQTL
jgi:hypothetical protein